MNNNCLCIAASASGPSIVLVHEQTLKEVCQVRGSGDGSRLLIQTALVSFVLLSQLLHLCNFSAHLGLIPATQPTPPPLIALEAFTSSSHLFALVSHSQTLFHARCYRLQYKRSAGAYTASNNALRGRGSGHARLHSHYGKFQIL